MKTTIKHHLSLDHEGGVSKTVTTTQSKKGIVKKIEHFPKREHESLNITILKLVDFDFNDFKRKYGRERAIKEFQDVLTAAYKMRCP